MKNTKYKLLTALFLVDRLNQVDRNTEYRLPNDLINKILENNYPQKVSREVKRRYVNKEKGLSRTEYKLTYLGKNQLLRRYPTLDYFQLPAGENLTMVVFNIPESQRSKRDRFRKVLASFGFGKVNRSFYLSPHLKTYEAGHFINSLAITDYVFALAVPRASFQSVLAGSNIFKFWDLAKTNDLYRQALANWTHSQDAGRFLSFYLEALAGDPFLPAGWLPKDWPGFKALSVTQELLSP